MDLNAPIIVIPVRIDKLEPSSPSELATTINEVVQAVHKRRPSTESGVVSRVWGDGHYNVRRFNGGTWKRLFCISRNAQSIEVGDTVTIRFYDNDEDKPYIKGLSTGSQVFDPDDRYEFITGSWSQSEGGPRIDYLNHLQNPPIDYTAPSYVEGSLGPSNSSYPIIGQVVFQPESGNALLAILWQKRRGSDYGLELTALDFSSSPMVVAWTIPIGLVYNSLSLAEQELTHRNGYLIHDKSSRQLCTFGHGSPEFRQWAYVVSESGELVYSGNLNQRAHQCAFLLGKVIKCWHSSLRPGQITDELRETQDPLIRAYKRDQATLTEAWNLAPSSLLPSCQISSSESHWAGQDTKGFGRWPIDGNTRTIWVWISGSERLPASGDNTLMQLLPNLSAHEGGFDAPRTYDYGRTKTQKATLVGLNIDTGVVAARLDITHNASYLLDEDSIAYSESGIGSDEGPTNGFQLYDWFLPYNVEYTYRGLAPQLGVDLGPTSATIAPLSSTVVDPNPGINEDEYCEYSGSVDISVEHYLGQTFPGNGPDYEFFEPGGLRLFPLPMPVGQQAIFSLPRTDALRSKNPVGGCMAIDSGGHLFAVYAKTTPIVSGRSGAASVCRIEEFDWRVVEPEQWIPIPPESQVPGGPTQYLVCAQRQLFLKFGVYLVGAVEQMTRTIVQLVATRNGSNAIATDFGENDCSQYVSREHSSLSWPIVGQVYQVLPIIESNVFLLLRDRWVDYPTDQLPSVCVDVWAWGSGSTLITTIELWADRSTYYDTEFEIERRKYDQYVDEIAHGKGSNSAEGYWVAFQLRVRDRETDTYSIERVRLLFDVGQIPTVTRTSGGSGYPTNTSQAGLQAIASDKSFHIPDTIVGSDWQLLAKDLI